MYTVQRRSIGSPGKGATSIRKWMEYSSPRLGLIMTETNLICLSIEINYCGLWVKKQLCETIKCPHTLLSQITTQVAHIFVSYIMKISIFGRSSSSLLFRISSSLRRERFERRVIFGKYWVRKMEIWNRAFLKSNPKKYFVKFEFEEDMVAHVVCRSGWRHRFTSNSCQLSISCQVE